MPEEPEEQQGGAHPEQEAATPKKSAIKRILFLVISLALIGETAFLGWHFGQRLLSSDPPPESAAADAGSEEEAATDSEEQPEADAPKEAVAAALMTIEPFMVNLADVDATHYMRLAVKLGMNSKSAVEKVTADEIAIARIRDAILSLSSGLTSQAVLSVEGKALLRKEIMQRINQIIKDGQVIEVYFIEMVVQ